MSKDSCSVTKRVVVLFQTVTCIVPFGIFVYTLLVDMFCRDGGLNENIEAHKYECFVTREWKYLGRNRRCAFLE